MANYNVTITNEGQTFLLNAVLGSNLLITQAKFSENDYVGQEATMTADDFGGVFISAPASPILVDSTTIKIMSGFDNDSFTEEHVLRSIGIFGEDIYDPYTPILVAVCTTTTPDIIPTKIFDSASTYAYNINLSVSDTENITIVDPQAAALYTTDVIDVLTSPATNAPLSANQGRLIADNLAANEESGAKNLLKVTALSQTVNDVVFTINADKSITTSGQANAETYLVIGEGKYTAGTYTLTGSSGLSNQYMYGYNVDTAETYVDTGSGVTLTLASENTIRFLIYVQSGASATETYYPMIRDARILDPTFVPFAETNLQLTKKTSGLSNRNLLDNPWFTVNQRGATTVTSNGNYGADRWKFTGGASATFSSSGVTLNSAHITQLFENHIPNGTYTASVKLSDGNIYYGTATKVNDTDEIEFFNNNTFRLVYNYGGSGNKFFTIDNANVGMGTITVRAVKLEVGSVSTLHLDVAPDPTTELLKCQRYFYRLTNTDQIYMSFADSANAASVIFNLPVPMRTTPTFSYAGSFYLRYMGANEPVTGIAMGGSNNERIGLLISTSGTLTIGQAGYFNASNTGSYLDFSADL